jgi:hypothetical protein
MFVAFDKKKIIRPKLEWVIATELQRKIQNVIENITPTKAKMFKIK